MLRQDAKYGRAATNIPGLPAQVYVWETLILFLLYYPIHPCQNHMGDDTRNVLTFVSMEETYMV